MRSSSLQPLFLLAIAASVAVLPAARADDDITAVAAKTSSDYVRTRLADGSYPVEYYAFGDGGHYGGQISDDTIDKLKFIDVARVISTPLAQQNYVPAKDPAKTKLVIMVYWGLTFVPEAISGSSAYNNFSDVQTRLAQSQALSGASAAASATGRSTGFSPANSNAGLRDDQMAEMSSALTMLSMANEQRDLTDFMTARLLGYDEDGAIGTEYGNNMKGTAFHSRRDDLLSEIEDNRYFVVLMAYDFQLMWKQKKHKLLWETRFSIRQRHHAFDSDLASMAGFASQYFGQDTHGLVRKPIPLGRVEIGDLKSLGTVAPPAQK
jgi:hypothetical protein